jgi:hypothetical protein
VKGTRVGREALALGLLFGLLYAALAVRLHSEPRLFEHLDQIFDADLGLWTIDIARPQGPHERTTIHPLSVLLLNPLGSALRWLLQALGVPFAARLAAALLCAVAGGAAAGVFRILVHRLGVPSARAWAWTLVFATSASQIVFASVPESFVFSALSLLAVFTVAGGHGARETSRIAAGVASFGITITNLGAVALARAASLPWRMQWRRAAAALVRHVAVVLLVAALLSVVQAAVYPTARAFFVPEPLGKAYRLSFVSSLAPRALAARGVEVASHLGFVCLAAPEVTVRQTDVSGTKVDFPPIPWRDLRPPGAVHAVLWALLLVAAARGLGGVVASRASSRGLVTALLLWLGSQAALHLVFGTSLFLYSEDWTFALVALTASGVESLANRWRRGPAVLTAALVAIVALQVTANAGLVADILDVFARRR